MHKLSDYLAWLLITIIFFGSLAATSCIPKPTNDECHTHGDCLSCVVSYCTWCGPRPGVKGTGRANAGSCYAAGFQPEACDPPPHYAFCYQDSLTPIDNRMRVKKPDGGADGGDAR